MARQATSGASDRPLETCKLLYSIESLKELARVLADKFSLDAEDIYRIISDIRERGIAVRLSSNEASILKDPADNLFINMAIDGGARTIVSGDSHLLKLVKYKEIEIISVSEFVKRFG